MVIYACNTKFITMHLTGLHVVNMVNLIAIRHMVMSKFSSSESEMATATVCVVLDFDV